MESLERNIRFGILIGIGAATLGAALFAGCSKNDLPNARKKNIPVKQEEYSETKEIYETSNVKPESIVEIAGPELLDPRKKMGLTEIIERNQIQESAKQEYQAPDYQQPVQPVKTNDFQNLSPLPIMPREPQVQSSRLPSYQTPKEQFQTPRTDNYQSPYKRKIQQLNESSRTKNNWDSSPVIKYQRSDSRNIN